jgi:hypothetical protein
MGIEPTWLAWKARTLPLSYTRNLEYSFVVVGVTGIEPATSWSQTTRAPICATPRNGGSSEARTPDTLIKSQVLYQLS